MKQLSESERAVLVKVCEAVQLNMKYDYDEVEYFVGWDELSFNVTISEYKDLDSAVRKIKPKKKLRKRLKGVAL